MSFEHPPGKAASFQRMDKKTASVSKDRFGREVLLRFGLGDGATPSPCQKKRQPEHRQAPAEWVGR